MSTDHHITLAPCDTDYSMPHTPDRSIPMTQPLIVRVSIPMDLVICPHCAAAGRAFLDGGAITNFCGTCGHDLRPYQVELCPACHTRDWAPLGPEDRHCPHCAAPTQAAVPA